MRIDLPAQARQAEGITLETAFQDSDGDHQQQPIDPLFSRRPMLSSWKMPDF
jgi:hypothetical protein